MQVYGFARLCKKPFNDLQFVSCNSEVGSMAYEYPLRAPDSAEPFHLHQTVCKDVCETADKYREKVECR